MSSREEPNWLLSVKGSEQGEAHVWEQEESWLFHKCLELLGITSLKSHLVLGLDFPPHFTKAWEERWRRQTFLLSSHEGEWHSESLPLFPYCVIFKSGEKYMQNCIPEQNPKLKRQYRESFICPKLINWLIYLQSTENHWSHNISKWLLNSTEKYEAQI